MSYVILNGKKSTLIKGLLIQSLPPISKPLMRTTVEEIDGRDGDVVTKLGYSAYDRKMSIGLFGDYDINEVIQYFDSEGTAIFSNEPDKFYNYQINAQIDYEKLIRFKTATVTFHVQPFKFSAVDDDFSFSINVMDIVPYTVQKSGITITSKDDIITVKGTATSSTQFYVPLNAMTLDVGSYTLLALTEGSGEHAVKIRVIGSVPSDADSLGGAALQLSDSGVASLPAILASSKTFNYIWFSIDSGTAVDFRLDLQTLDEDLDSCEIINRGNTFSRPKFTISGEGTIKLSINDVELFVIELGDSGYITLDGQEMNAYKDDILMNRAVSGDYSNLKLDIGTNKISWVGNIVSLEVQNVSRWI